MIPHEWHKVVVPDPDGPRCLWTCAACGAEVSHWSVRSCVAGAEPPRSVLTAYGVDEDCTTYKVRQVMDI